MTEKFAIIAVDRILSPAALLARIETEENRNGIWEPDENRAFSYCCGTEFCADAA
jgi:hypothetical protein